MHLDLSCTLQELMAVAGLSPVAKTLYTTTLLEEPRSLLSLTAKVGLYRGTVSKYCRQLANLGWFKMVGEGRSARPVAIVPKDVEAKIAKSIHDHIELKPFRGEETAKAFAAWIVSPTVRLFFNVRPPFLNNKGTGYNLECDILAPDYAWAGEYQGAQHFGPTELYKGEREFIERFKRDRLKAELCREHGVRLSYITKDDLTLERLLQVIPQDIPRRTLDPNGPCVEMLGQMGRLVSKGRDWDRD